MGKYEQKKKKKHTAKVIAVVVVLIVALATLGVLVLPQVLYRLSGENEATDPVQTDPQTMQSEETDPGETAETPEETGPVVTVAFPLELENGDLVIESLFQYEGINPDCENQEGKNIASIMLTNASETFLEEAEISLKLSGGTVVNFCVTDLPAGRSIMAFSTENASIDGKSACVNASCEAAWAEDLNPIPEEVSVSVDGMVITLTNGTDETISELVIYCRSTLGEELFGGVVYQYMINDLPANGTATVEALECFMGMAEVVRIVIN